MTNSEIATGDDCRDQARRLALQQLRSLQQAGVDFLPQPTGAYEFESLAVTAAAESPTPSAVPAARASVTASSSESASKSGDSQIATSSLPTPKLPVANELTSGEYESAPLEIAQRVDQLKIVEQKVSECTQCSDLVACRTNTVFGVGSASAELCFLGEGPGADEDKQGEPFVGRAGQLLDKILAACKLSREEVYILNTVKCRPPGNRNPNETELANCWPYAIEQLELIQPKFICCLGSVAARTLLQTTQSIGRMRGQFFQYRGSQVLVTYHPAYLLRNPSAKRQVWDDMKLLLAAMGREV